jgi:dipeptidyl aminopeptidase/acylaminoacyl peptidase
MTIDDLIGAVRIADPQLSPDGRTVVFVRTTTDLERPARERRHLARAGGRVRRAEGADRRAARREHAALLALTARGSPSSRRATARRRSTSRTPTAAT